nr:theromacin-like antimicrobial peptide [Apocyclops royi]
MLKFLLLAVIVFAAVEANVVNDCWETWSRCSRWSSGLTGILWQSCPQRCQCLGWSSGRCELKPSRCPLSRKAWACTCTGSRTTGRKPRWCGF